MRNVMFTSWNGYIVHDTLDEPRDFHLSSEPAWQNHWVLLAAKVGRRL